MKCVGAEDGSQPCQRCRRTGVEYVHIQYPRYPSSHSSVQVCVRATQTRPKARLKVRLILSFTYRLSIGYRLSEASTSTSPTDWRMRRGESRTRSPGRYSNDLPRLNLPTSFDGDDRTDPKLRSATDDEENDSEGKQDGMFPADLIRRENQRHSFFKTILNPSHENPATSLRSDRSNSTTSSQTTSPTVHTIKDPVSAGIIDESNAKVLFALNPRFSSPF